MEHPLISARLARQNGVVAVWQLRGDGVSRSAIEHAVQKWREIYDGVYLSGHAWPTAHQRLMAAALTAPQTAIDRWSAAHYYGLRDRDTGPVTVVRPGSGGQRRIASRFGAGREPDPKYGLALRRSIRLPTEDLVLREGILMVAAARVVLDLLPVFRREERRARLVRDALRLEVVSALELHDVCKRHRGRRGAAQLRGLLERYARLPATRAKSDAELLAADILEQAGFVRPRLNVLVAGEEGDLVFVADRHIVELDSHGFHPFPVEDERKQRIWEAAGWSVDRLPTDDVYNAPGRLLQAAIPPHRR